MAPPNLAVKLNKVSDVQLFYERSASGDPWGDLQENEKYGIYVMPAFGDKLQEAFDDLWAITGQAKGIITAGGWTDKPGAHGLARAFDLDGITWAPVNVWRATMYETPYKLRYYYGLMCHFHLYFGNVLGKDYNAAHADHIHMDDLVGPALRLNSRAMMTTLQGSLTHVHGLTVPMTGAWDKATHDGMAKVVRIGQYPTEGEWRNFLRKTRDMELLGQTSPTVTPPKTIEERLTTLEAKVKTLETWRNSLP